MQPRLVDPLGLGAQQPAFHFDPGCPQQVRAAGGQSGCGSSTAYTTRRTPARSKAVVQAPVRPVCEHGSSVTTAVPPRARSPASCRATTSACGPPAKACQPCPAISPAASSTTQPTTGLGLVRAEPARRQLDGPSHGGCLLGVGHAHGRAGHARWPALAGRPDAPHGLGRVVGTEDRRAGHKNVGARLDAPHRRVLRDPAVDLDPQVEVAVRRPGGALRRWWAAPAAGKAGHRSPARSS